MVVLEFVDLGLIQVESGLKLDLKPSQRGRNATPGLQYLGIQAWGGGISNLGTSGLGGFCHVSSKDPFQHLDSRQGLDATFASCHASTTGESSTSPALEFAIKIHAHTTAAAPRS